MDFLVLFLVYVVITFVGIVVLLYVDNVSSVIPSPVTFSINFLKNSIAATYSTIVPSSIQQLATKCFNYIFFSKNPLFAFLYISIVIAGHLIYGVGCLPYVYAVHPHTNHVFWPMVLLMINTACFMLCWLSDPGILTAEDKTLQNVFPYDGIMYQEDVSCTTCHINKPARSKHCAFLDHCVFRFDHYCAWVNNTVAGLNHRWFVLFLVSLCVVIANSVRQLVDALHCLALVHRLWQARWMDEDGRDWPMDWPTLVQTLFMRHPYVVFLTFAITFTLPIIAGLLCYHLYLMATNQTTNERYKKHHLKTKDKIKNVPNPYDKGVVKNIVDAFFPWRYINAKKVEKSDKNGQSSARQTPSKVRRR